MTNYTPLASSTQSCALSLAHLLSEGFSEAAVAARGKGTSRDAADHRRHPVLARRVLLRVHVEVVAQLAAGDVSLVPAAVHRVSPVMLLPSAGKHPGRKKEENESLEPKRAAPMSLRQERLGIK